MSDICSQTQTPLLLGGRRELPALLQRTDLAQGAGLLLWALLGHSVCVHTYPRAGPSARCLHLLHTHGDEHQEDVCVEKGPDIFPKGPVATQQSLHTSVTHHASTISHIPVKTPTTMHSWEMGNPKVCFDLWILHKDNLTILILPQLCLL